MNNLIINKNKIHLRNKEGNDLYAISKIKYREIPSLLPGQISGILGIKEDSIKRNRLRNHDKFREGLEIFTISGIELIDFMDSLCGTRSHSQNHNDLPAFDPSKNPKKIRELTLYTYEGFLNMVKIVNTSEAWEIYDILKDCYFKMKSLTWRAGVTPNEVINSVDAQKTFMGNVAYMGMDVAKGNSLMSTATGINKRKPKMKRPEILLLYEGHGWINNTINNVQLDKIYNAEDYIINCGMIAKATDKKDIKAMKNLVCELSDRCEEPKQIDDNYFEHTELWADKPKQIETNNVPEKIIPRRKKQFTVEVIDGTICKIDKDGNRRRISKEEREDYMIKK